MTRTVGAETRRTPWARRMTLACALVGLSLPFTPAKGAGQVAYGVFFDSWRTTFGESRLIGTNLGAGLVFQGSQGEYNRWEQRGTLAFFFVNVDNTDSAGGVGDEIPKFMSGSWGYVMNLFDPSDVELYERRFNPRLGFGVGATAGTAGAFGAAPIVMGGLRVRTSEGRGLLLEAQYWMTGGAPRTEFSVAIGNLPS